MTKGTNIPTAMTDAERTVLVDLCNGKTVLEIGALFGYSTLAIAEVARKVVTVDPFHDYPNRGDSTLAEFMENIRSSRFTKRIVPIVGKFQDVCPFLMPRFDVVFIDITTHAWEAITMAERYFSPYYIVVHDMGHPRWTGATKAVKRFMKENGTYHLEVTDSLAVMSYDLGSIR